jgi:hypothetical protein
MSVKRPKMRSVEVTARERAVVGHIVEAAGIPISSTRVGRSRLDPVM